MIASFNTIYFTSFYFNILIVFYTFANNIELFYEHRLQFITQMSLNSIYYLYSVALNVGYLKRFGGL